MSRRGENIYKRKDGRWEGRYVKARSDGKTKYGYVYAKTYREVKKKLLSVPVSEPATVGACNTDCFQTIAGEWLAHMRPQLKESSTVKYENIVNRHLLPTFADRHITDISLEDAQIFCSHLLSGKNSGKILSPKTVSDILAVMKNIFAYAKYIKKYTVADLNGINIKLSHPKLRVLSTQEQDKLQQFLSENMNLSHLGILLCLCTGLRIGELCALKWDDILLEEQTVYVHRTMQRLHTAETGGNKTAVLISSPKSDCSVRKVPIPQCMMTWLTAYQCPGDTFFLTELPDKYVEPRTMQNRLKKAAVICGIGDVPFHSLRHTFATRCVELGFDLKSLSEILGHSNINITLNRYVHPSMELKQRNMDKISTFFSAE